MPYKRSVGVRMIPRYGPIVGWALERWVPARAYGTRDRWYTPAVIGGTMLLVGSAADMRRIPSQGEYPSRGDYEYTGYLYTNEQLAEHTVLPIVQALRRSVEELPVNPERRIAMRTQIAIEANKQADLAYEEWAMTVIANAQPAFNGQIMSGYGKKRPHSMNEVAKRLGIREHTGRS